MNGNQHFRREGRQPINLKVQLRFGHATDASPVEAELSDLGMGGAFILTSYSASIGAIVSITISTPTSWEPFNVDAEIRWVSDGSGKQPPGLGVNFLPMGKTEASALYDLIQVIDYKHDEQNTAS
ncbi:MAG: PilZ domain-containing protein [Myxococcales bacterium]|nr:MAG: PilZ domain-containing protein [Myxococcales bacterium]